MFSWKRDSADISDDEPIFRARYIGCTETLVATGPGCTSVPLRRMWSSGRDRERDRKYLRKVTIQISTRGIFMYDVERAGCAGWGKGRREAGSGAGNGIGRGLESDDLGGAVRCSRYFCMEDISYCAAADASVDDRVFCWVWRNVATLEMELHAVLCSGKEKAHTMAGVLSRAFRHAYRHWKADRMREVRRDQYGQPEAIGGGGGGGGSGGGGGGGGRVGRNVTVGPRNPCVGLAIYSSGGNPLNKVKLEKGSQGVSSKSTTSV